MPIPKLLLPVINPAIAPIPAIDATGPATDPTLCALCALTSRFCSFNCCLVNGAACVASLFLSSIIFNSCFNATSLLCSTFSIWRLNEFCWALKSSCTFDIAIPGFVEIGFPLASKPPDAPIAKLPGPLNPGLGITFITFDTGKTRVSCLFPPNWIVSFALRFPVPTVTWLARPLLSTRPSPGAIATWSFPRVLNPPL